MQLEHERRRVQLRLVPRRVVDDVVEPRLDEPVDAWLPELADRRVLLETWLTYRALVEALQGRDKLFIDGNVPVRPHLLPPLPELRLPPGLVAPKEKDP